MGYEELKQRQSVMCGSSPHQRATETLTDIDGREVEPACNDEGGAR